MYYFTDMPVIISGRYFLILDPQQESLPRSKHFKRKQEILGLQHWSAQDNQALTRRDSPTLSESSSMHVSEEQEELNVV